MKPSTATTATPSGTVAVRRSVAMRSSAPFSPAVKPTGWAAVLAWHACYDAGFYYIQKVMKSDLNQQVIVLRLVFL